MRLTQVLSTTIAASALALLSACGGSNNAAAPSIAAPPAAGTSPTSAGLKVVQGKPQSQNGLTLSVDILSFASPTAAAQRFTATTQYHTDLATTFSPNPCTIVTLTTLTTEVPSIPTMA